MDERDVGCLRSVSNKERDEDHQQAFHGVSSRRRSIGSMSLKPGKSRAVVSENIREMMAAGAIIRDQAVVTALARSKRPFLEGKAEVRGARSPPLGRPTEFFERPAGAKLKPCAPASNRHINCGSGWSESLERNKCARLAMLACPRALKAWTAK